MLRSPFAVVDKREVFFNTEDTEDRRGRREKNKLTRAIFVFIILSNTGKEVIENL